MEGEDGFPTVRSGFIIVFATLLLMITVEGILGGSQSKEKLLLLESLTIAPVLGYVWIRKFSFRDVFRWHWVDPSLLLVSGLIGLGLTIVADELSRVIQIVLPIPEEVSKLMEAFLVFRSKGEFLIIVLAVVVIAGIAEEMLFRGFFQGTLERVTDVTKAVLITAFVFAFMHLNPWWLVELIIMGVLLGVLAWRSGSIFPSVVVHMVKNSLAVVFANTDTSRLDWYFVEGHISPVWVVLGLGCVVFGFWQFYRLTEKSGRGKEWSGAEGR